MELQRIPQFKALKSRLEGLEYDVFESGSVKHAAQFTTMLEDIADYIKIKYNSNIVQMVRAMFVFLARPTERIIM